MILLDDLLMETISSCFFQELFVYRCALACAQFPVLSAPTPPENETPPPGNQGAASSEHRFSYALHMQKRHASAVRRSLSDVSPVNGSEDLHPATAAFSEVIQSSDLYPGVSSTQTPDVYDASQVYGIALPASLPTDISISDMVSREMLCDLVRNAFHQSLEQQLRHEQLLRQDFGRRSKGEVCAVVYILCFHC